MLQWVSVRGYLIRKKKSVRPSSDNRKNLHYHRSSSSFGTFTDPIAARWTTQQGRSKPGDQVTSWWEVFCWASYSKKRKNWAGKWRLGTSLTDLTMRWWSSGTWEEGTRQTTGSQLVTAGPDFGLFRDLLGKSLRDGPGEKRGSGELVDFQGSPFPISKIFYPHGYRKSSKASLHRWTRWSWQNMFLWTWHTVIYFANDETEGD